MKKTVFCCIVLCLFIHFTAPPSFAALTATTPASIPANNDTVANALNEFGRLSRKERKGRIREAKKVLKEYKSGKKPGIAEEDNTIILAILSILLPPLAVYLKQKTIGTHFWICLLLTLLFWLPGIVFALLIVFDVVK